MGPIFDKVGPMLIPGSPQDLAPFRPAASPEPLDPVELRRLQDGGLLRPVIADVLAPADLEDDLDLRARAAALLLPARLRDQHAVVGFASAAWLLTGWTIASRAPSVLDVIVSPRKSRAASDHLVIRQVRLGDRDALELPGGLLVTTPTRTAADVARDLPAALAEEALTALHTHFGVEPEAVSLALEEMKGARGVVQGHAVLRSWADGAYALRG